MSLTTAATASVRNAMEEDPETAMCGQGTGGAMPCLIKGLLVVHRISTAVYVSARSSCKDQECAQQ